MTTYRHTLLAAGLLLLALTASPANAAIQASYDCQKASTSVEKQICHSSELARLDVRLNHLYWKFFNQLPADKKSIARQMQRNWIINRERDCQKNPQRIDWFTQDWLFDQSAGQEQDPEDEAAREKKCIQRYLDDAIAHLEKGILISITPFDKTVTKSRVGLPGVDAILSHAEMVPDEYEEPETQVKQTSFYANTLDKDHLLSASVSFGGGVANNFTTESIALRSYLLADGRYYQAMAEVDSENSGRCTSYSAFSLAFFKMDGGKVQFFHSDEEYRVPYTQQNSACGYTYGALIKEGAIEQGLFFDSMQSRNGIFSIEFPEVKRYLVDESTGSYQTTTPIDPDLTAFNGTAYRHLYQTLLGDLKSDSKLDQCQQISQQFGPYLAIKGHLAALGVSREQAFYTLTHMSSSLQKYPKLSYFQPSIQALLSYLEKARKVPDWQAKLQAAVKQYPEPNHHGFKDEVDWAKNPFQQAGFEHDPGCFSSTPSAETNMSLEEWLYAFWARRVNDGTLEQSEQILRRLLSTGDATHASENR